MWVASSLPLCWWSGFAVGQTLSNTEKSSWEIAVTHVASDFTEWEKEGSTGDSGHHLTIHNTRGRHGLAGPVVPTGIGIEFRAQISLL